jgi:butyryl-CoA dehydrogenase
MIHEGTHGIQALDLLGRKVGAGESAALLLLAGRITATAERSALESDWAGNAVALTAALQNLTSATRSAWASGVAEEALANAVPYLQAFGHVVLAWIWLDVALAAQRRLAAGGDKAFCNGKLQAARYFFAFELPKVDAWLGVVRERNPLCREMRDEWF